MPAQERAVRLNVMRHLATQLQALSKQFRHAQKDFLVRLRGQEEVPRERKTVINMWRANICPTHLSDAHMLLPTGNVLTSIVC